MLFFKEFHWGSESATLWKHYAQIGSVFFTKNADLSVILQILARASLVRMKMTVNKSKIETK